MKSIIILALALSGLNCVAQETYLSENGDTLYTASGFPVVVDNDLKIGTGTTPSGTFKYIRTNSASLFAYGSNTSNAADNANAMGRNSSGMKYRVVRIEKRGNKKRGYVFYPILSGGAIKYECDIDNAIACGEISVPDEYKKKDAPVVVEVKQPVSIADELIKLKKLKDDGVLTEEEFQAQKKKLLGQ